MIRYVMAEKCATCIFHPDNRMHLVEGRLADMVRETDENDTNVICHQSKGLMNKLDVQAWCRGSVDRRAGKLVRFAEWAGVIEEVLSPGSGQHSEGG